MRDCQFTKHRLIKGIIEYLLSSHHATFLSTTISPFEAESPSSSTAPGGPFIETEIKSAREAKSASTPDRNSPRGGELSSTCSQSLLGIGQQASPCCRWRGRTGYRGAAIPTFGSQRWSLHSCQDANGPMDIPWDVGKRPSDILQPLLEAASPQLLFFPER